MSPLALPSAGGLAAVLHATDGDPTSAVAKVACYLLLGLTMMGIAADE